MPIRVGSLCSGYGGLDMALGGQLVWTSDLDKTAARVLAHRYPDIPNVGDLTAYDWTSAEPVDVITAGFPCQPFSTAGARRGIHDERWLWDDVANVIEVVRPARVVLENVPALLSASGGHAMGRVLAGLSDLGYVGRWGVVAAADVGAPHIRSRVFIVATHAQGGRRGPAGPMGGPEPETHAARTEPQHPKLAQRRDSPANYWGKYDAAIGRWERSIGRPAPDPLVWGRVNPRFTEWMMGLPDGWVTDVPGLSYSQQIHCLGNGVVPQQAAYALRLLETT